jgi:probable O-glycosylation ligase (exosortase A-associated)
VRNLVILAFYGPLIVMTLTQPFIGVLLWFIMSIGAFHTLSYGFTETLPWAYIVGGVTIVAWILNKKTTTFVWTKPTTMLVIWGLWIQITMLFAINFDGGEALWEKFLKIWFSTLFISMFLNTKDRINAVLAAIAGSIGFYGAKAGVHLLLTGSMNAQGPADTNLADNNDFGLGCVMMLPLLFYLRTQVPKRWQRRGVTFVFVLTLLATFATNSRGAFVAMGILGAATWWKARGKIRMLVAAATIGVLAYSVLPQSFFDRMNSIDAYQSDESAETRLHNWQHAILVANDRPIVGGGMGTFRLPVFLRYNETIPHATEAHSIYFEALGDQGYGGLAIFIGMWLVAYMSARRIRRMTRDVPEQKWAYDLGLYYQLSLIAYASGGAFLSQAYLDLYYAVIVIIGMTRYVVERSLAPAAVPSGRPDVTGPGLQPALPAGALGRPFDRDFGPRVR